MRNITWVILRGGLGNQLFQYYAGLKHSLINKSRLYIDVNHIHEDLNGLRHYELNNFKLPLDGSGLIHEVIGNSDIENNFFKFFKRKIIGNTSCVHPSVPTLNEIIPTRKLESAIFDGYFQNANLYDYLLLDPGLLPRLNPLAEFEIIQSDFERTCAITVRLKDYLKFPKVFGDFPLDYYEKAVNEIIYRFNISKFDLYSDDVKLDQTLLAPIIAPEIELRPISTNNALNDFVNISKYKYKIIANSSFSWWAAFINPNAIVYYMDPWLLQPLNQQLGLSSWRKVERNFTL